MSTDHYLNSEDSALAETALKASAASMSPAQWEKALTQGGITKSEETTALKSTEATDRGALSEDPDKKLNAKLSAETNKNRNQEGKWFRDNTPPKESGGKSRDIDYKKQWQEKVVDTLVGWRERRWQRRHQNPSQRALQESWNYYAGLYQTKGPDGKKLQQLIRRNGIPDWGNPYLEGMPEYYEIHPEGLLMSEVEFLLNHIEADLQGLPENESTSNNEDGEKISLTGKSARQQTMEEALWQGNETQRKQEQQWRVEGRQCWAILLTMAMKQGHCLQRLRQIVHPDNLWFITWEAYQTFPEEYLGITKEDVLLAAKALSMQFPELEENTDANEDPREQCSQEQGQ